MVSRNLVWSAEIWYAIQYCRILNSTVYSVLTQYEVDTELSSLKPISDALYSKIY
jgi:hypothetical protein